VRGFDFAAEKSANIGLSPTIGSKNDVISEDEFVQDIVQGFDFS
jgi:hypothetical protein